MPEKTGLSTEFIQRVMNASSSKLNANNVAEVIDSKQSDLFNGQKCYFSITVKMKDGTFAGFRGKYDGSWDELSEVAHVLATDMEVVRRGCLLYQMASIFSRLA
jgi:hypothetical protein